MSLLQKIQDRLGFLHPLNYLAHQSQRGDSWVCIESYDCLGFSHNFTDVDIDAFWNALQKCSDDNDVENMMCHLNDLMFTKPWLEVPE